MQKVNAKFSTKSLLQGLLAKEVPYAKPYDSFAQEARLFWRFRFCGLSLIGEQPQFDIGRRFLF